MSIVIKRQIVSESIAKSVTYGNNNNKKYITVHQTGNTNKGANAQAHANLQSNGNSRSASWHYSVDDKEAIQSFEDSAQCWAAGDGRGPGNLQSIHVEICVNSDGDYKEAVKNGAKVVKYLMDKHGISIGNVRQHFNWSGKNCPAQIRANKDGISWSDFISMVKKGGNSGVKVDAPKSKVDSVNTSKPNPPKTTPSKSTNKGGSKANLSVDGRWGSKTTRALQKALGTPQDGIISSQPRNAVTAQIVNGITFGSKGSTVIRALQKKVGAKQDGKLGPNTVRSLQRYLGTPVDGVISNPSMMVKELQRRLNAGTF